MSRVGKKARNSKDVSITINKDKITVKGKTEP
jgi:ribosomal protein L6P/L9E